MKRKTKEEIERENRAWEDLRANFGISDLDTLCNEVERTRPNLSFFSGTINLEEVERIRGEIFN